jgi:hypothetical protein
MHFTLRNVSKLKRAQGRDTLLTSLWSSTHRKTPAREADEKNKHGGQGFREKNVRGNMPPSPVK